jgi:hypothetical protein
MNQERWNVDETWWSKMKMKIIHYVLNMYGGGSIAKQGSIIEKKYHPKSRVNLAVQRADPLKFLV